MLVVWGAAAVAAAMAVGGPRATAPTDDLAGRTVALPLHADDDVPALDRAALDERFEAGLTRSGFELRRAPSDHGCTSPTCFRDVAVARDAATVTGAEVTVDGPDYRVRTYVISGQTGEVVVEIADVCEICGIGEVGDMVEGLAARLRPKLENATAPARLLVESDPPGAIVRMDGRVLGTTPLDVAVPPGKHEIEVGKEGYLPSRRAVELTQGIDATYTYALARRTRMPGWVPWATLGVGLAATAGGIALLVIDEDPIERDCNPDVDGRCQYLHDTLAGGAVLTASGLALTATGVGLVVWRSKRVSIGASANVRHRGLRLTARF